MAARRGIGAADFRTGWAPKYHVAVNDDARLAIVGNYGSWVLRSGWRQL
jgi:hypothetical protein